jgi:hypothetical protein
MPAFFTISEIQEILLKLLMAANITTNREYMKGEHVWGFPDFLEKKKKKNYCAFHLHMCPCSMNETDTVSHTYVLLSLVTCHLYHTCHLFLWHVSLSMRCAVASKPDMTSVGKKELLTALKKKH